jgi:uncharacterized protein YutE (UPF0331/DUF86 family)
MTPADRQSLVRKIGYLQKTLDVLMPYRELTAAVLLAAPEKIYAVERLLQTTVESVIDSARLIVALQDWRLPKDERDAFLILAEHAVIDDDLAQRLLRAKGFRNVLVHEYVAVDTALVIRFLQSDLSDIQVFAIAAATWIGHS